MLYIYKLNFLFSYCALWAHIRCERLINTLWHYCREPFISVTGEITSWCWNNKIIQRNSKQCLIQANGSKICTKYLQASCLHGKWGGNSTGNTLQLQHTCRQKSGPSVRKLPDPPSTTFDLHTTADIRRKSIYAATTYHHSPKMSVMITRVCLVLVVSTGRLCVLHRPVVCSTGQPCAPQASCVCSTCQSCAPQASSCVLHRPVVCAPHASHVLHRPVHVCSTCQSCAPQVSSCVLHRPVACPPQVDHC